VSRTFWVVLVTCAFWHACSTARGGQTVAVMPPAAIQCSVEPKVFDPNASEKAVFRFKLPEARAARVWLVDPIGRTVATVGAAGPDELGFFSAAWDGRDSDGRSVPSDAYCYLPASADYAPSPQGLLQLWQSAGERLECKDITYDPKSGEIRYLLPQAGRARVRVGISDGPVLRSLLDYAPLPAGRHTVAWDGKDSSGNEWSRSAVAVHVWAFSLPQNCVIVQGATAPAYPAYRQFFVAPAAAKPDLHATHTRQGCHEPAFAVSFPGAATGNDGLGVPKTGRLLVHVQLDPRDHRALVENLFEIVFYIDGVFFFEDSNAADPFTCTLDLTRIGKGRHILSVQVMDFEDHAASRSFGITCQEPGK